MSKYFPGQSGNPGGRAKVVQYELEKFRNENDLKALRAALKEIALDAEAEPKDRIAAIKEWHDRAYGKPSQHVTYTPNVDELYSRVTGILAETGEEDDPGAVGETH